MDVPTGCAAMKATAATAGVGSAAAAAAVTSMLGESELGRGNERQGENSSKSRFEQSGFPHFSTLHKTRPAAQAGKPLLVNVSYLIGISFYR